ncbi:hypothetical protein Trydic_g4377 [Trypoxylus dichotomus]
MVSLDLQKLFDKIRHEGLLPKMKEISFPDRILKTITSYLNDRRFHSILGEDYEIWSSTGISTTAYAEDLKEFLYKLKSKFFKKSISSDNPAIQTTIVQRPLEGLNTEQLLRPSECCNIKGKIVQLTQCTSTNYICFRIRRHLKRILDEDFEHLAKRTRSLQQVPRKKETGGG